MVTARKASKAASSSSTEQLSKQSTITTETSRSAASTENQANATTTKTPSRSKASTSSPNQNRKRKATISKKAPSKSSAKATKAKKAKVVKVKPASKESDFVEAPLLIEEDEEQQQQEEEEENVCGGADKVQETHKRITKRVDNHVTVVKFVGEPVNHQEAVQRWPHRYQQKRSDQASTSKASTGNGDAEEPLYALKHYLQADVDGQLYNLEDDAYVQAEENIPNYICKIREIFQGVDGAAYFTAQWYYRAEDTIIKNCKELIEKKRIFFSEIKNDNPLECLVQRLNINRLGQDLSPKIMESKKEDCDFFYDMLYLLPFTSFVSLPIENGKGSNSKISCENGVPRPAQSAILSPRDDCAELTLLDLYSGCGAMSTGLSLGANTGGVKLTTKWAVDFTTYASDSLRLNHPETQARCESASDFLLLLKEWESLCVAFTPYQSRVAPHSFLIQLEKWEKEEDSNDGDDDNNVVDNSETFEIEDILDIRCVDVNSTEPAGLYFLIRWKGYGEDDDTWEPLLNLSDSPRKVKEFVIRGFETKILPLPGSVDVICGGPPCQGISGFNRFRNSAAPLEDVKNKQLLVYMDIIKHLKPRFVLMENVVDILKFSSGYLGRHAFGKLVGMDYQARLGLMAAGSYGLPQFRQRIFLWGALKNEKLPGYPLPTHKVINRGVAPKEFEANMVAYEEGTDLGFLKKELHLGDAISDLPRVENDEVNNEVEYGGEPLTEFQRFIRQRRGEMPGSFPHDKVPVQHMLYDHRPLELNGDDIRRVRLIPMMKSANFRNLPGVQVGANNKVEWDPEVPRKYFTNRKPLVPDYAMKFVRGTSTKPFGRLWYDETVATVMTRAEPHNHALLHPNQARVVTVRENARLQGFPDYYKLTGNVKEKYIQVGNAVAVPVACALGYSLARTICGLGNDEPVFRLPDDYPLYTAEGSDLYTSQGMEAETAAAAETAPAAAAAAADLIEWLYL